MPIADSYDGLIGSISGALTGAFAFGAATLTKSALEKFFPNSVAYQGALNGGTVNAYLSSPVLNYFPIYAEAYRVKRTASVATSMIIAQSSNDENAGAKSYVVDNIAPQPRRWTMKGYLMPLLPIDGTVFKPTLLAQKIILDNAIMKREPLSFKTMDGEFVEVLVQDMEFEESPKYQNAVGIQVQLIEFIVNTSNILTESENLSLGQKTGLALGAAIAASISVAVATSFIGVVNQ